jgi:hypothetical protein
MNVNVQMILINALQFELILYHREIENL